MQKIVLLSILVIGTLSEVTAEDVFSQGTIGKELEVVVDKTTQIQDTTQNCPNFRYVCSRHEYTGPNHTEIFYHIYQCIKHDGVTVDAERVYFSYTRNGKKFDLPKGCPPPTPQAPEKKDPCKMGYDIGQTISETISNLIVPQLLEDDPSNPESQTVQFQKIDEIRKEMKKTDNMTEFNDAQLEAIKEYERLIEDFAKEKIKCFTENVIPNKKVDIELICAEQGAYETIEEALQSVLKDKIDCGAIGCEQIKNSLSLDNMVHRLSLNSEQNGITDDWNVVSGETNFQPGVEDFNGNVQIPVNGESYLVQTAFLRQQVSNAIIWNGEFVIRGTCSADDKAQRFIFENRVGFFRMRNEEDNKYLALRIGKLSYVELTDENDPTVMWRIVINPDGSVTFLNRETSSKTIGFKSRYNEMNIRPFNKHEKYERFYIRNECTTEIAFTRDMETQGFTTNNTTAVTNNAENDLKFSA